MIRTKWAAVLLAGSAWTVPYLLSAAAAQSGVAPVAGAAMPRWAHQGSDLQPDPAARFGQLANGMRYVIYRNATPPGQVAVRMRFDVGDLMEEQDQNGLAHFIEHMAFNGTTNIPEGELVRILERQGLAFGRDTNAFTAPDQTVYEFTVPGVTDAKLDTALLVMREIGGEVQFNAAAIDRERGIIQSEDRSMYPPLRRAGVERDRFLLRDQLIGSRLDIGDLNVIRTAPRERFVDLYRKYYRPERATLVVVGDIDPAAVEAKIRTRFADWRGNGAAGGQPDLGRPAQRPFEAGSAVADGAFPEVSLNYVRPYTERPDTLADEVRQWRERLALSVLNRRFARMVESGEAPFTEASAYSTDRYRSVEQTTVRATPKPGQYEAAVRVVEQEVRRLQQHGILDSELQLEVANVRAQLTAAAARAGTLQTAQIADTIIQTINRDDVFTSPAEDVRIFEAAARGFDGAQAHRIAQGLFTGSGPLLFATSPAPIEGGHARLASVYEASRATAVAAPVAVAAREWPYQSFGAAGRVVEREEIADLGVTRVRFANGVNLLVKPTTFAQDQVIVNVRIGGGDMALPKDLATTPLWQGAFVEGGLGRLTYREMTEALTGKIFSTQFLSGEDSFGLRGTTRPADLATQLQVLAAYASDPAWGTEAFERKRAELLNTVNILATMPMNMALTRYPSLVRSGDLRFGLPSAEQIAASQLAQIRSTIDPVLKSAPLEVVVVGNISVDEAIAQTAATFGALPQRRAEAPRLAGSDRIAFTPGAPTLQHRGRQDVTFGMVAYPTDDFYDNIGDSRALQVLRSVLQIRTIDKLREELGATYSPVVLQEGSENFDEFGLIAMGGEVAPAQLDRMMAVFAEVAEGLKQTEISADELERARAPMLAALDNDRAGNSFWANRLAGGSWQPRRLETIRQQQAQLRAVTPAMLRRLAQSYFNADRSFRLKVLPTPPA